MNPVSRHRIARVLTAAAAFLLVTTSAPVTRADGEGPLVLPQPKSCFCGWSDPLGPHSSPYCCLRLAPAPGPACTPCLNGCDANHQCVDRPFVGDDGFPLEADSDTCDVIEVDGAVLGECDGGYAWRCDATWCADTRGRSWRLDRCVSTSTGTGGVR